MVRGIETFPLKDKLLVPLRGAGLSGLPWILATEYIALENPAPIHLSSDLEGYQFQVGPRGKRALRQVLAETQAVLLPRP